MKKILKIVVMIIAAVAYALLIREAIKINAKKVSPTAEDCLELYGAGAHEWEYWNCMKKTK